MRLNDTEFNTYMDPVYKLDWTGLDLTLVGAIVSDWETQDIDCVITGEYGTASRLIELIQQTRACGPFDIAWTADPLYKQHTPKRRIKTATAYVGSNQLIWNTKTYPIQKMLFRQKLGRLNGEPIKVIQNGTQIYL